jgi:curli biogenesis system outer membrane secretion channel CsgG
MKSLKLLVFLSGLLLLIVGCGPTAQQAKATTEGEYAKEMRVREPELPKCDRPLGTIVARGFKCKAAACVGNRLVFGPNYTVELSPRVLGEGLSDMLVTALVQTGCFKVLERETLKEIKEELELLGVQPRQTLRGADFLLTGAITALEMKASGVGGGGGALILPVPLLGGVKVGKQKAHIALDLRVVRVRDAEILLAKAVEGKSERWKFGVGGGGIFGTVIAGGWFEVFKNTPMEEATRDLIYHAVKLIVNELRRYGPVAPAPVTPVAAQPEVAPPPKPVATAPAGGIRRARQVFQHGDVVLWEENFSTCKVIPRGLKILRGTGECIEFGGKKWLASIKDWLVVEKELKDWNPSGDWALEMTLYVKKGNEAANQEIRMFIGRQESPVHLRYRFDGFLMVNGKELPKVRADGQTHTLGLLKRGDTISVFIDGQRWGTVPVDSVVLSRLKGKLIFSLGYGDIERGSYSFITDIKLSQFSK